MIGSNALKKKSTVWFPITDGNAKAIPSLAQEISQVKNEAILLMIHVPIEVPNINQVMRTSTTNSEAIGRHFISFFLGEHKKTTPITTKTPNKFNKKYMQATPRCVFEKQKKLLLFINSDNNRKYEK